ncbi:MAG: glycosyltransferase family 2 protein, partial [Myxococcota bacterium]
MKRAILIPMFNEEKSIGAVLSSLSEFKKDYEIVVVDDGSYDNSLEVVKNYDVTVLRHCINAGYGATIQTGLKYLYEKGFEQVILFDGDGQHPVESINQLSEMAIKSQNDIVIGSRFIKDYREAGFLKSLALRFFTLVIHIATGVVIKDPTSGFKCLSRRAMRYYISDIMPLSFPDADAMILAIKAGLKIGEVPVTMKKRISGRS